MKRIITLFPLLLILLLLSACVGSSAGADKSEQSHQSAVQEKVPDEEAGLDQSNESDVPPVISSAEGQPENALMTVAEISDGKAICIVENTGREEVAFGEYFELEQWQNDQWQAVSPIAEVAYHDIAYVLLPGGSCIHYCYLDSAYGDLTEGSYRILMDGMVSQPFRLSEVLKEEKDSVTAWVDRVDKGSIEIGLINGGQETAWYGWSYGLAKWQDGAWQELEPAEPIGVCGVKDLIEPNGEVKLTFDLEVFGTLEVGIYRLTMDMDGRSVYFSI